MFWHIKDPNTSLINKKAIKNFIHKYAKNDNWHNLDSSSGNLGYGWIHYAYIRLLQPERILCIGSKFGFIPAVCALACKDNNKGIVDFVDAGFDEANPNDQNHWGGVGLWKKIKPSSHFQQFGAARHILPYIMTTEQFAKLSHRHWGYIYIDGDHSYFGAKRDYQLFWPKLLTGGHMAFHDIYVKRMGNTHFGVYKLWLEIKKSYPQETIEFPGQFGLGIVTKKTSHPLNVIL